MSDSVLRAFCLLLCTWCLTACQSGSPSASSSVPHFTVEPDFVGLPQYLPPEQLADKLRRNLLMVRTRASCEAGQTGFGWLVGQQDTAVIAIPGHLLADDACAQDNAIQVRYCNGSDWHPAELIYQAPDSDLAFITTNTLSAQPPEAAPLARQASPGDPLWLIGFDGRCTLREHGQFLRYTIDQQFFASAAALGGSSGGVLFSEWGAVGQVLAQQGRQMRTLAMPLTRVKDILSTHALPANLMETNANTPPQSREAARQTYASYISRYLFYATQISNTFSRGEHGANYLLQNIPPYNKAYIELDTEKAVFIGHLTRFWPELASQSSKIITELKRIHLLILSLNEDLDALAANQAPTAEFDSKLTAISEKLLLLRKDHQSMMEKLND